MSFRIAHVTATFPPYRGGTGNVCFHNARELVQRGHNVDVYTAALGDEPRDEQIDGIGVHRLRPLVRFGNAVFLPQLWWKLRGFDLIHLHYPFYGGEMTALAARANHIPLLITYHQDVVLGGWQGMVERGLRRSVVQWTLRSASTILFTSADYGRASYIQPLLRGRPVQFDELPNGVDVTAFTPGGRDDELRAQLQLCPTDRVVLLVAGLDRAHYFKGVDVLLRALAALPEHVVGVIVGDGDLRPAYQALAGELGVQGRVRWAGRVSNAALPRYYQVADLTVLPSVTMGEAFGLVLVESLATATPVIASDLPGVRTVVASGSDGFLVPPGDPNALAARISELLDDDLRRQAMGQRGRKKVEERYDWKHVGARLESIYRGVATGTSLTTPLRRT